MAAQQEWSHPHRERNAIYSESKVCWLSINTCSLPCFHWQFAEKCYLPSAEEFLWPVTPLLLSQHSYTRQVSILKREKKHKNADARKFDEQLLNGMQWKGNESFEISIWGSREVISDVLRLFQKSVFSMLPCADSLFFNQSFRLAIPMAPKRIPLYSDPLTGICRLMGEMNYVYEKRIVW